MKFKVNDVLMMNPEYSEKLTYFSPCEIILVNKVSHYYYSLAGTGFMCMLHEQTIPKNLAPTHFTYLGVL